MNEERENRMKLLFVSLGCDKNLVDTEFMLGMLRDDGIEITNAVTDIAIIIIAASINAMIFFIFFITIVSFS